MHAFDATATATLLAGVATLLLAARALGELARRLRLAPVVGELSAGVLLGPTVLGALAPGLHAGLFPAEGPVPVAHEALALLGITLFLLVTGLEIELSAVWRQGRAALWLGAVGIAVPFATGFVPAWLAPEALGAAPDAEPTAFALFFAAALSITALPVLARILFDLKLLRSELGVVMIAAAILNDLAGWLVVVLVLSTIGSSGGVLTTALGTLGFAALLLTLGRRLLRRVLPFVEAHTAWPAGVLALVAGLALLAAAFTEWLGVHAVLGAFLLGVALGDSHQLRASTRAALERFVSSFFAPLFFASVGLRIDFAAHFDPGLVALVLALASFGKLVGCGLGARSLGFGGRQAVAIAFGMNARGAMEIVLGLVALRAGIVDERLFVALVVMALVTSAVAGFGIEAVLARRRPARLVDHFAAEAFSPDLGEREPEAAIQLVAERAARAARLDPGDVGAKVLARERLVTSAIGNGIAVPHARIAGLERSVVGVGLAREGLEFGSPDGRPVRLLIVVLTPAGDPEVHLGLLADVARRFPDEAAVREAAAAATPTEFRAALNARGEGH